MNKFWQACCPLVTILITFLILGCSHLSASADDGEVQVKGNVPVTYIPRSEITFDADGKFKVTRVSDPAPASQNAGQEIDGNLMDKNPEYYQAVHQAALEQFESLPVYRYEEYYIAHEGAVAQYDDSGNLIRVRGDCEYYSTLDQYMVNGSLPNGKYVGTYLTFSRISNQTEVPIIAVTNYRAGTDDCHIRICVAGQDLQFLTTDPYGIPFIDNQNRVQVPVRKFTEAIGGTVEYHDEEKIVTIVRSTDTVVFQTDSNKMFCNGAERQMDTPAQNIGGRIYVPLRALSEALDYKVVYTAKDAAAVDCRISRDEVIAGETHRQSIGAPATDPSPLTSAELDTLIELYNQMCMISPRCEVDRFDTVNSYDNWVYLTMRDGSKVDLCLRMQNEWEVRCFAGSDNNYIMHSPDLYSFITHLYQTEQE